MSEINIEIGTFPTRDEGLPTMGLMIQTPYPIDIKREIISALKLQESVKELIEILKISPAIGEWTTNSVIEELESLVAQSQNTNKEEGKTV